MGRLSWSRDPKPDSDDYLTVNQAEVELPSRDAKTAPVEHVPQFDLPPSFEASKEAGISNNVFMRWRHRYSNAGWRNEMIRVAIFSTSFWLLNIIVYIILYTKHPAHHGSGVLMESSCSSVQHANTAIHAALNIVTSLMLSASNFAMQSLSSPTREEIDAAHAKNRSLGIGGLSMRNFRFIKKSRSILWILLWISSIPLHLFFNAVFFTSSKAHQYSVAVVSPTFFTDPSWIPTVANSAPSNFAALGGYANATEFDVTNMTTILTLLDDARGSNASLEFTALNPSACMDLYAVGFLQRASDVVVVTNSTSQSSSPLIWTRYPERTLSQGRLHTNEDSYNWICRDALQEHTLSEARDNSRCTPSLVKQISETHDWTVYGSPVQYCLSRPEEAKCSLYFNVFLMLAVLVCGIIKTAVIIWICVHHSYNHNIRTFGDAVNSFLTHEDETTHNLCLIPSKTFVQKGLQPYAPQRYIGKRQRWYASAGRKQFWTISALNLVYIILLSVALYNAIDGAHGTGFDFPLGQANIESLTRVQRDDAGSSGVVPNLLLANVPQVAFSLLYVGYNDIFAKIYVAREFNEFHQRPGGLRVSEKRTGAQRGSRFLNLPIHWGLVILSVSTAMHWLTSQALFPVRVDGIDNAGVVDLNDQLVRLGYNCRAITALVVILCAIVVVTVWLGWVRRFEVGFGEMGNSLVISAACHPPPGWNVDRDGEMGTKELSWGDVTIDEVGAGKGADGGGEVIRHCSFAPMVPRRLVVGAYYS